MTNKFGRPSPPFHPFANSSNLAAMGEIGSGFWQATVTVGLGPVAPFADFMEQDSVGVSVFETPRADGWVITALYRKPPDAGTLSGGLALAALAHGLPEPALEVAPLAPADWLAEAYAGFPARHIGRFYVHGSHIAPAKGGALSLRIDAATAFGSGEHATTEGCLRALDGLARRDIHPRRILDMGIGSGILAIAAAKLFPAAEIAGVDIDAESARVANLNARLNGVAARVRAVQGDGYNSPLAADGKRFDVIVSNILARPLARMAPSLARRLVPGGTAILSGLLRRQEKQVLAAHRAAGLVIAGRKPIGEWMTLIVRKP
jgi:ribosomal protein L11 methyltransferase